MMREYPPKMRFFLDTANIGETRQAAKAGAHITAIPFKVLTQMMPHPLLAWGWQDSHKTGRQPPNKS